MGDSHPFHKLLATAAALSFSLSFIPSTLASIGPTADLTLVNVDVSPDGFSRSAVTVNGIVPGPLIVANKVRRQFSLNVINTLTDDTMLLSSSIHWRKARSLASTLFIVVICLPDLYRRRILSEEYQLGGRAGTFWYHSHLSTQYCDGLRGVMVVYDPEDPHLSLYDVDDGKFLQSNITRTIITLSDWYHDPAHNLGNVPTLISTLINGLGRYAGGPTSQLAVISVTQNKRYRFRLASISCDPNFIFTIDGHNFTIIEADSVNVQPLNAGQRYSFVLNANQAVDNYWIRTVANGGTAGSTTVSTRPSCGTLVADAVDPTTNATTAAAALDETNLHPLVSSPVPGRIPLAQRTVALNLVISLDFTTFTFQVNGAEFVPPTAPVLLQILSGAHTAAELLPNGSLTIPGGTPGAPHPFHLHGHNFWVVRSAGSTTYNWDDPVIRDVVTTGSATTDNTTIRFVTDNAGPVARFPPEIGLAIVFAEDTDTIANSVHPSAWDTLCPTYDALTSAQLGGL
ncbi:multicopper oxidase/laccase [Favolaschia claudopus]|uniref:Multicopper oxidase/laccase n=1 Tax=Favolaschia claudopus TaxID=2862362 RepID=A0AAV9Z382_9AGAR